MADGATTGTTGGHRFDLRLSDEQQQLVGAFAALFARRSGPEQVRAAEPLGFDEALWRQLVELGAVAMAVDEAAGGWGATPLDLALVAEQHGRAVAPAPTLEAQAAVGLLARVAAGGGPRGADPGRRAAAEALVAALDGGRLTTLALHPVAGGQARAGLVPAAAVADAAVVLVGDRLVLLELDGARAPVGNLGSMPVADVDLTGAATTLATGPEAVAAHDAAVDDWLRLAAAALVGVGARALEIGVEYVKERKAWGVPVGSFQAVSHRLADSATALDGARLLAYEAAWAATEEPARAPELAALAFAFASEAARDATYRSLHFHGGYGFMLEYDVQLHWRRARAWANVWGSPAAAYRRAGDRRYGPPTPGATTPTSTAGGR